MLTRFDPFAEMSNLRRDIERLFERSPLRAEYETLDVGPLPLDLYEEGNTLIVKASLPELKPEEVKVEVRGDALRIFGESKKEEDKQERNYHLKEHRYTRFERSVVLPAEVLVDKASATFENGVLTLTLPKTEATPIKQIPIKTLVKG
jgi:HSP20 family protein